MFDTGSMGIDPGSAPSLVPDDDVPSPIGDGDDRRAGTLRVLRELVEVTRPVTLADERLIPVDDRLVPLLGGGLERGTTIGVTGTSGIMSAGLSLCARATSSGLWMGCLNIPSVGWAAADAAGVDLRRVVSVDVPPPDLVDAAAAMIDVFDLVICEGLEGVSRSRSRNLSARVRERGCVLLVLGGDVDSVGPTDVVVDVDQVSWSGLGHGHGRLRSRSARIVVHGRGELTRPRTAEIG